MECQNTIKNLKINKKKSIGEIIIVVEGEKEEFKLLKHIFTKILNYNYISIRRNKIMTDILKNKKSNSTVIIANTKNSHINSIKNDKEYKEKLFNILKKDYNKSLKNTPIYMLWDRDKENNIKKMLNTFKNSRDNEYEMNGLLLLSYPCIESFEISNIEKNFWQKTFKTSKEIKKYKNTTPYNVKNLNEKTLLLAVENMHKTMLNYKIYKYNTDNFLTTNMKIFGKETEIYKHEKYFDALSLISILLIDLGIIIKNE